MKLASGANFWKIILTGKDQDPTKCSLKHKSLCFFKHSFLRLLGGYRYEKSAYQTPCGYMKFASETEFSVATETLFESQAHTFVWFITNVYQETHYNDHLSSDVCSGDCPPSSSLLVSRRIPSWSAKSLPAVKRDHSSHLHVEAGMQSERTRERGRMRHLTQTPSDSAGNRNLAGELQKCPFDASFYGLPAPLPLPLGNALAKLKCCCCKVDSEGSLGCSLVRIPWFYRFEAQIVIW